MNDDPEQLLGLDASGIVHLLGVPHFVRREGPTRVWQYRAKACILDLFLYREGAGYAVGHVELRGRGPAEQTSRQCFLGLLGASASG